MEDIQMKRMSDSYLYQGSGYNRDLYNFIVGSTRIDPTQKEFEDIVYNVRMRQVSPSLVKILLSNRVVLCTDNNRGMSRAFKVFQAVDPKSRVKDDRKIFIDCTGLIENKNGVYVCKNIGILISYLVAAMGIGLYYGANAIMLSNAFIVKTSTAAFVDMALYTMEFLKVPVTIDDNKANLAFIIAEYFLFNVLQNTNVSSNVAIAKSISGTNAAESLHMQFADVLIDGKCDIDKFIKSIQKIYLNQDDAKMKSSQFSTENFVEKWAYLFGPSTYLGLELFTSFSQAITDCFVGSYINQQNTIEKIVGGKNIIKYSNELLKIGSDNI